MKIWRNILLAVTAIALAGWPVASLQTYAVEAESSYDTCISSWSGRLSDLSSLAANAASSDEVFCGHFMSVENFPTDDSAADFVPSPQVFTLQTLRLSDPVFISQLVLATSEHNPHSLHPEVAPHPPKHC